MRLVVKRRKIPSCILGNTRGSWLYKIIFLEEKLTYQAKIWGYDDDEGYLAQFQCQEVSLKFSTKQEAIDYAEEEWVFQEEEE